MTETKRLSISPGAVGKGDMNPLLVVAPGGLKSSSWRTELLYPTKAVPSHDSFLKHHRQELGSEKDPP